VGGSTIKKVIVIGLDGLEPSIVEAMLAAGELPNLARLVARGGLARIATTYPAQTPVAWSTFATGTNPGGHGVFDFLGRDPKTYRPDSGLSRYEQKNVFLPPRAVNLRRGEPVWDRLAASGVGSVVLRCPCTYPPDRPRGRMLSGMGVPDLRGGFGTSTFYGTASALAARESEHVVPVRIEAGQVATYVIGPRHPKTRADSRFDIALSLDPAARRLTVRSAGTPGALEVREGQWSDWLRVKFKLGALQSIRGMVRFHLVRLEPELELYASPVNFDPASPMFPISAPPEYAEQMAERIGLYHTAGMVEDHGGLSNERFSEEAFLAQCEDAWRERQAMMEFELNRFDSGLFYCLYDTPDRVQHMLWRLREPDHPANRDRPPARHLERAIEECYQRADGIVGRALERVDDQTLLIVLSDHGFGSFRRGVNINRWLFDRGLLALRPGIDPGSEEGDLLAGIDWEKTRAYGFGLSGLYLNLRGREGRGTVAPEEAESLKAEIALELTGLTDPENDRPAIVSVSPRERLYQGPYVDEAPDLIVNCAAGYRISWSSTRGVVSAGPLVEDNTKKWSGDHIIDPALVPGVLLMSQPFRGERARLIDMAPTILAALGVGAGPAMEGETLLP
jgi:predicted AlkP superfamily phosphohydrolase/phosphomutase